MILCESYDNSDYVCTVHIWIENELRHNLTLFFNIRTSSFFTTFTKKENFQERSPLADSGNTALNFLRSTIKSYWKNSKGRTSVHHKQGDLQHHQIPVDLPAACCSGLERFTVRFHHHNRMQRTLSRGLEISNKCCRFDYTGKENEIMSIDVYVP